MAHAPFPQSSPRSAASRSARLWRSGVAAGALAAALLLLPVAAAQALSVSAGADIYLAAPGSTTLGGSVTGLSPIDYWAGDGNNSPQHQWENHLLHYNSQTGLSAVGPLVDPTNPDPNTNTYGFPTDLMKIGSTVYGLDQYFGQIYTVDLTTGYVTPVGPTHLGTSRSSLAYDASSNILYTEDFASDEIYALDPATGAQIGSPISSGGLDIVYGMAFNPANSLLYMVDTKFRGIYTMDPANPTALATFVTQPNWLSPVPGGNRQYSELQFYDGKLYGMFYYTDNATGMDHAQLREITLTGPNAGSTTDIGPQIDDASLHSLMIDSLPEDVEWTVVSGPGTVQFTDPTNPGTAADFSAPGKYVLQLSAVGNGNDVLDTVNVFVPEPAETSLLLSGLLGLMIFGSRGRKRAAPRSA